MPRRIYTYGADQGWDSINMFMTIGSLVIVASFLAFMVNVIRSLQSGERAGDNPWGAATIEWSISSPPPHYNFLEIPTVTSRYPLWEEGHSKGAAQIHGHDDDDGHAVHMPDPSYWPLVLSAGIAMLAGGLLIWKWHQILGFTVISTFGLLALYATYRWAFEPVNEPNHEEPHQ
jgi:heme/copper-type cytochrome/quinol oxidase subunit 1